MSEDHWGGTRRAHNAVVRALGHQREEVLDTETIFDKLIDAVIGVSTGTPVDDAEARNWAAQFLSDNDERIRTLGASLDAGDMQTAHLLSYQFKLPPIPNEIEQRARRRADYDRAVIGGLAEIGLSVTEIQYPHDHLFISTWTGRDGGRVDIHEYAGLPVRVVSLDFDTTPEPYLVVRRVEAHGDPIRDANAVVDVVRELWLRD